MSDERSPEDARLAQLLEESEVMPSAVRDALREALSRRLKRASEMSGDEPVGPDQSPPEESARQRGLLSRLKARRPTALINEARQQLNERVSSYSAEQLEQLKLELLRLTERLDLQGEAQRLLSRIAIDVTLTIKLAPEDEAPLGVKPQVKASAKLRLTPDDE